MNVPVISFTNNFNSAFSKTRMCKKILCENLDDDSIVDNLIELGKKINQKSVLILTKDSQVEFITNKRQLLEPYYYLNLPSKETVNITLVQKRV